MHCGGNILARPQYRLSCGTQGRRPESLGVFVLLGNRSQCIAAGRAIVFFEFQAEPPPDFLGEAGFVVRRPVRTCLSHSGWNRRTQQEHALPVAYRPHQVIPMSLFHSASMGTTSHISWSLPKPVPTILVRKHLTLRWSNQA